MSSQFLFFQDGQPTAQLFGAFPVDEGKLSGSRSDKTTAMAACIFHVDIMGRTSVGTWGVSVSEVNQADSRVVDDSVLLRKLSGQFPPGHCYVDLRNMSKAEQKRLRSTLIVAAQLRGCLYSPEMQQL